MGRQRVRLIAALWFLHVLAMPALAGWNYSHNDGSAENAIGVAAPGNFDMIMLERFVSIPSRGPLIDSISISFGFIGNSGLAVGSPIELVLYEDPNGATTRDATLRYHSFVTVQTVEYGEFNTYDIPPTVVHNIFLAGVVLRNHSGFAFPGACDLDPPQYASTSFLGSVQGVMDIAHLTSIPAADYGSTEELTGIVANWLINAHGDVPEPTSAGVALIGLLCTFHRPSRRTTR